MTNNVQIIPVFTPVWTLSVTNTPGGSVIVDPSLNLIKKGSRVVATAIPDDFYGFRGWKGTFTSTANPLNFVFETNTTLIAEFDRLVRVSLKQTEGGSVAVSPVLAQYVLGNTVKVTASAVEGYRFQGWKAPFDGLTDRSSITLTNDIVLEGLFKKLQKVAVSQSGEGTVVSTNGFYADIGESITLLAQPKTNWAFTGWSGSVTNINNPVTIAVSTNTGVTANFKRLFTLTVTGGSGGTVEVTPKALSYVDGSVVTLLAKPDRNQRLIQWSGSLNSTNNPLAVTVTNNLVINPLFGPSFRMTAVGDQILSDGFRLKVEGESGAVYFIETSSGLISWSMLTTITNTGTSVDYLDKQARSLNRRFYRMRPENP